MLAQLTILVILILLFIAYKITKSLIHPAVITCSIWGIILSIYQIIPHDLYPLSNKFFYALLLWIISFYIASIIPLLIKINFPKWIYKSKPNISFLKITFYTLTLVNIYQLYRLYTISSGESFYNIMLDIKLPLDLKIISYLNQVSLIICLSLIFFKSTIKKYQITFFILILLGCYLLVSVKTSFAQLFFAIIFYLYYTHKLNIKRTISILIIFSFSIISLQIFRGNYEEQNKKFDLTDFFALYILSPLPAFDMVLQKEVNYKKGKTFHFFEAVSESIGVTKENDKNIEDMWVFVPISTNVYTVMFTFYNDFGYYGILCFGLIIGCFWGILFKGIHQNINSIILLYSVLFYSLILQFFADYIFTFLSITLQIFIIIYLLFFNFHFYSKKTIYAN